MTWAAMIMRLHCWLENSFGFYLVDAALAVVVVVVVAVAAAGAGDAEAKSEWST